MQVCHLAELLLIELMFLLSRVKLMLSQTNSLPGTEASCCKPSSVAGIVWTNSRYRMLVWLPKPRRGGHHKASVLFYPSYMEGYILLEIQWWKFFPAPRSEPANFWSWLLFSLQPFLPYRISWLYLIGSSSKFNWYVGYVAARLLSWWSVLQKVPGWCDYPDVSSNPGRGKRW